MTLNDLLRQGRSITEQLNSGDIPLIDAGGKEVNIQLTLNQSENKLACEIAFVRRKLDDMTDEQLKTMTKDEANKALSYEDKVRWATLQNSKASLYFIRHGNIEDVPAEGWRY